MSSLSQRSASTGVGTSNNRSGFGKRERCSSTLQTILFIPYFSIYLLLSTVLSLFVRGGGKIARTFLALYTLGRLLIGFFLLIFWRVVRIITEWSLQACDCFFLSKHESNLLNQFNDDRLNTQFEEWLLIGNKLDQMSYRIENWKKSAISDDYDYELLESQLNTMIKIRSLNDSLKMMQTISHVFRRTFCSLHNGNLYNYTHIGTTKEIISKFYCTLEENINFIANDINITNINRIGNSIDEKLEFFHRCKRSLGRSALCLSGGGALAMAHVGVVRALIENDCFPKVISGTSGGAIIAGYLATITESELKNNLDSVLNFDLANKFGVRFLPTLWEQLFGAYRTRILMDTDYFVNSVKKYVGNLTFREAWLKTGRHVSITVSYSNKNQNKNKNSLNDKKNSDNSNRHAHAILLNHITAPDTYIWSAVTASCSLPGLMKPQQLYAKVINNNNNNNNNNGERKEEMVPYYPDGIQWVDGSLQADIPRKLLQEMFRVNYFIVSQVNPHVTPFINKTSHLESFKRALLIDSNSNNNNNNNNNNIGSSNFLNNKMNIFGDSHAFTQMSHFMIEVLEMLDDLAYQTVNHQLDRLVKLKAIPSVYGHSFDKFASQDYTGDITIIPKFPLNLRFKILAHPTDDDMKGYIKIGERATWQHIKHIENMLRIEKLIDKKILKLKAKSKEIMKKKSENISINNRNKSNNSNNNDNNVNLSLLSFSSSLRKDNNNNNNNMASHNTMNDENEIFATMSNQSEISNINENESENENEMGNQIDNESENLTKNVRPLPIVAPKLNDIKNSNSNSNDNSNDNPTAYDSTMYLKSHFDNN